MADYKPSDFFISLVDFFGILLPGSLLLFLLKPWLTGLFGTFLPRLNGNLERWVAFLIGAYIAGHILHQFGDLLLDVFVYDRLYVARGKRRKGEEPLLVRARELMGAAAPLSSAYSWAGSYVRAQNSAAAAELDKTGAESKFFRSWALVLVTAGAIALGRGSWMIAVFCLVLAFFALWRFCDRRWKATQLSYEYFVLLRSCPPPQGAQKPAAAV